MAKQNKPKCIFILVFWVLFQTRICLDDDDDDDDDSDNDDDHDDDEGLLYNVMPLRNTLFLLLT